MRGGHTSIQLCHGISLNKNNRCRVLLGQSQTCFRISGPISDKQLLGHLCCFFAFVYSEVLKAASPSSVILPGDRLILLGDRLSCMAPRNPASEKMVVGRLLLMID